MATDVIIDPSTGQIYWNDSAGVGTESISIKGDAVNTISFTGYSGSFSPGSTPSGALTLVTIKDSAGTDALIPGTSGYNLGSSTLRWNTFATNANLSGTLVVSDSTISSSLLTGSTRINGGIAISGNASIGQSLNFYNTAATFYTGFKAGTISANTLYTLPTAFPGSASLLQSDASGTLTWVGSIGTATTATNVNVVSASTSASHPVLFTPASGTASGAAVSTESTFVYNPSTDILSVSGLAITSGIASTSSTTGALVVTGGAGIAKTSYFGQDVKILGTTASGSTTTGALVVAGGVGIGGSLFTAPTSKSSISGVSFNNSRAENGLSINATSSYTFNITDAANNQRLNYHADSNRTEFTGNNATHEIRLIHSNNSGYTGFKANSSGTVTYTLPAGDGSNGQALTTNGSATLSWTTITGGSGGGGTGVQAGGQYEITYYTATGASVNGSSTFKNDTAAAKVIITHTTVSSSTTTGALVVTGGIGVGGKVFADVLQSGGNCAVGGNLTVAGTVDLGNATADSISFLGRVDTDIAPIATNTYDLGDSSLVWKNVSIGSSAIFYNTNNANTLGFRAGVSGASLIYVFPIDTPTAGQVLSATAPSGGVVTLSWEDDQTGAPAGGITTLNTLTAATQSFATGTSGTDFAISSATSTHTFNLPDAGSSARGVITTSAQTIAGAKTFSSALSVTDATVSISSSTGALKVTGGVGIGGTLFTSAGSTSSVSGVLLQNGNVSASTYNKLTLTAPATSATLTLAQGSTLATSGANSLTFTTTAASNVTFPTAGTLTTQGNKLSVFALTSGTELAGVISDKTGTGNLVFASSPSLTTPTLGVASATTINKVTITAPTTSATLTLVDGSTLTTAGAFGLTLTTTAASNVTFPTAGTLLTSGATSPNFLTSVTTSSGTFALFNTTATTINAFGAATVMSIGAATGKATFNSTDDSSSTTTGSLAVSGGAGFAKSVSVGGRLQMFNGANFTAFVSSASGNTVYTLPATSPATGSSVLQSTSTGVMSWVPMTAGGSATPGGTNLGDIQYKSGSSFAAATTFNYDDNIGQLSISSFPLSAVTSTSAALKILGTSQSWNGSSLGSFLVMNAAVGFVGDLIHAQVNGVSRLQLSGDGYLRLGAAGTGFTLPVTNGTSGQVLTANTNGVASWTTVSGGSSSGGTVYAGTANQIAFYGATGNTVGGTGLIQVPTSGTAISVFTNFDLRDQNDIRFFNADNSRFAALQASNVATNYTLSLPTAPVGNGYSTILVDTSGNMYFAPLEGGLATTSATGNRVVLRNRMEHHVWISAGYTPSAAGADNIVYLIPDSSDDGSTKITFLLKEFTIRVETPSTGPSRIQLEKSSTDTGAFTLAATGSSLIGGFGLTVAGAGIYVTSTNTFAAGLFVTSGNLLRLNWTLLNATHANFSVQFTLNEV